MGVQDVNRIPQIQKNIKELNKYKVQVGIFAPEGSELFMIAMVNEYGAQIQVTDKMRKYLHANGLHLRNSTKTITIPERSFIRGGFESIQEELNDLLKKLLPEVLMGSIKPKKFYEFIGEFVVGKIHNYLVELSFPTKHPFTLKQEGPGKTNPLINTGHLNQSITWQVVEVR